MKLKDIPPLARHAMKRMKRPLRTYLSMDDQRVFTTQGTIERAFTRFPYMVRTDVGSTTGTNAVGHKLPASGEKDD